MNTTAKPPAPVALVEQPPKLPPLQSGGKIQAIVPTTFEDAWRIANVAFKSGMAPKDMNTPEKCMVAIMHGMEVGLPPMAALQSIAVINNRPTIWGDAAIGLVRNSGLCVYIKEWEEEVEGSPTAFCVTLRKGEDEPVTRKFSLADQTLAGLMNKDIHQKYPARMRQMRARAFCLRDTYADVLKGLHIREEVMDYDMPANGSGVSIPPPPPPPPTAAQPTASSAVAAEMVVWEDAAPGEDAPTPPPIPPIPTPAKEVVPADKSNQPIATHPREEVMPASTSTPTRETAPPEQQQPGSPPEAFPELPAEIDRRPTLIAEGAWLRDLEGAFTGCEDLATFGEKQRGIMAPQHGKVSPEAWRRAIALMNDHAARITNALATSK